MTLDEITQTRALLAQIELTLYFGTNPNDIDNIENWGPLTNAIATYVSDWTATPSPVEP